MLVGLIVMATAGSFWIICYIPVIKTWMMLDDFMAYKIFLLTMAIFYIYQVPMPLIKFAVYNWLLELQNFDFDYDIFADIAKTIWYFDLFVFYVWAYNQDKDYLTA
jgi:hypothetical protein